MDYYKKKLFIPQVDEQDKITGKIERWEAHTKGILHRGFTVGLYYKDSFICQHRRHPVFDGVIDLTASSHQIYSMQTLQGIDEAIGSTLSREWNIQKQNLASPLKFRGKVAYRSSDSVYIEHEICHFYTARITQLPQPQFEYLYGYSLFTSEELRSSKPLMNALAPWLIEALRQNIF